MPTVDFNSVVRGHHVYMSVWHPTIGERLMVCIERGNAHDRHAVSVQRESTVVGHVPREVSKIFKGFLMHEGEIECEITGSRRRGNGLEVPCVYHFTGKDKTIIRLVGLLKKSGTVL